MLLPSLHMFDRIASHFARTKVVDVSLPVEHQDKFARDEYEYKLIKPVQGPDNQVIERVFVREMLLQDLISLGDPCTFTTTNVTYNFQVAPKALAAMTYYRSPDDQVKRIPVELVTQRGFHLTDFYQLLARLRVSTMVAPHFPQEWPITNGIVQIPETLDTEGGDSWEAVEYNLARPIPSPSRIPIHDVKIKEPWPNLLIEYGTPIVTSNSGVLAYDWPVMWRWMKAVCDAKELSLRELHLPDAYGIAAVIKSFVLQVPELPETGAEVGEDGNPVDPKK